MMCMTVICPHIVRHTGWAVHINSCNYYYLNASKTYFYGFISFYFLARSILYSTVVTVWVSWTLCNTLCKFWSSKEADVKVGLDVLETHWGTGLWGIKGKGRSRQGEHSSEDTGLTTVREKRKKDVVWGIPDSRAVSRKVLPRFSNGESSPGAQVTC